ncbi:hypothetical protein IW261DRAFT_1482388 [Armillaria novae-zelandiae]|uniref:F-box domain-containing protein n=1 Tax=Armillaria novae-zelandiae TaxID=153914 RepID=A0AA39P5Z6_9AGAR|nr:hypothetical protein IW261DRAFT_1482388 [Armillaria novae-zelandiae]
MSSVSKINQLPDELLALIFATGLCGLTPSQHPPLLKVIRNVCRHWRDVAIEASELWTTIHFSLERHLLAVQSFLECSKGRLIDLHIIASNSDILAHKVAEITAPHISRTRTLTMTLPNFGIYNIFLQDYRSIFATNLSSLSIHFIHAPLLPHERTPLFAGTDSLSYLDTDGYILRDLPSRTGLTTLKLKNYSPTHLDLQILFDASPCLETLVLHDFDLEGIPLDGVNDDVPTTIIPPTTLKSLAVSAVWAHSNGTDMCCCILDELCIPDLEYLEVVGGIIDANVHFRGLAKLQTLRVQDCTVSPVNADFFLSLKELRRLELVDVGPGDIRYIVEALSNALPSSSSPSFPHLSSVFFATKGEYVYTEGPDRLLRLAKHCVTVRCPRFTIEVEQGRSEEFLNVIGSSIEDDRVCVRESNCLGGLIKSTEMNDHFAFDQDSDADEFMDDMYEWDSSEPEGWDDDPYF